jgi:hypothetical protein
MSARNDTIVLMERLQRITAGMQSVTFDDANTLRRAEKVLHRWHEQECGDSTDYASYSIERDEQTGIPYRCIYPHREGAKTIRQRIADKEAGAIKRVSEVCKRLGLSFFVQTDPRGCALYVSNEALTDSNYSSRGISCCV